MRQVTIDEQKRIQIGILDAIDEYCRENNIEYFLAYGTLLGAIRHKGYIPWDDDIDIIMSRDDYIKFSKGFNENRNDHLRLVSIENTKDYYLLSAKVCDMNTLLYEDVTNPIELGVYVDVFINDYLSDSREEAKKLAKKIHRKLLLIRPSLIGKRDKRPAYKEAILSVLKLVTKDINRNKVLVEANKIAQTYLLKKNSKYCGSVTSQYYGEKEIMLTKWWTAGTQKVLFEGHEYSAPIHFHKILTQLYGDYVKVPPQNEQVAHHANEAFWRSE